MYLRVWTLTQHTAGWRISYSGNSLTSVPARAFRGNADYSSVVTGLELNNQLIQKLEECAFCRYNKLVGVYMKNNQLTHVSQSAFNRTLIKVIDLSMNRLSCMPDLSAIHKSLAEFNFHTNRLTKCDRTFVYRVTFKKLYWLNLVANGLHFLEHVTILWSAPSLRYVYLNRNRLVLFPNFLPLLPRLHVFNLEGSNILCTCGVLWLKQVRINGLEMRCPRFNNVKWTELRPEDYGEICWKPTVAPLATRAGRHGTSVRAQKVNKYTHKGMLEY